MLSEADAGRLDPVEREIYDEARQDYHGELLLGHPGHPSDNHGRSQAQTTRGILSGGRNLRGPSAVGGYRPAGEVRRADDEVTDGQMLDRRTGPWPWWPRS